MCTRRGEIQPAQGEHCGGIKTTNTPPSPLRVQRFNGMKRTSRVVIPPHIEVPKKHCVQEGTACPSAQSTHSEKAVFSAEINPARGCSDTFTVVGG